MKKIIIGSLALLSSVTGFANINTEEVRPHSFSPYLSFHQFERNYRKSHRALTGIHYRFSQDLGYNLAISLAGMELNSYRRNAEVTFDNSYLVNVKNKFIAFPYLTFVSSINGLPTMSPYEKFRTINTKRFFTGVGVVYHITESLRISPRIGYFTEASATMEERNKWMRYSMKRDLYKTQGFEFKMPVKLELSSFSALEFEPAFMKSFNGAVCEKSMKTSLLFNF